jgi:hypothetical protein
MVELKKASEYIDSFYNCHIEKLRTRKEEATYSKT